METIFDVVICRDAKVALHRFITYFKGFEKVGAVRELFGEETEMVLSNLKIEFGSRRGYMGVSDEDGHLMISASYLRDGDKREIYLDIIHELVHVKQFRNGIELHDNRFEYINRPTEIEAYAHAVKEARRIGMTEKEICQYLWMERMSEEEVKNLAANLNVKF
jgi:hypothetical protein